MHMEHPRHSGGGDFPTRNSFLMAESFVTCKVIYNAMGQKFKIFTM